MTQQQPPYPPSPYPPMPYHPHARRPYDPAAPARRASVLMWVLGAAAVLFGLCFAAALPWMLDQMMASGPSAEVAQLRDQLAQIEQQARMPVRTQLLVSGVAMIVMGGVLGMLAFFVRGGGRGSAVTAAAFVGLVIGFFALNLLGAVVLGGNPGQALASACMMVVPLGLLGLLMVWLVQAARNAPQVEAVRHQQSQQQPGDSADPAGWQQQQLSPPAPQYPPPASAPLPPPHQPWAPPPAGAPNLFGPAPFGIPPPPDDTPPGRYGYATRPTGDPAGTLSGPASPSPGPSSRPADVPTTPTGGRDHGDTPAR